MATRPAAMAGPKILDPVITAVFSDVAFGMSTVGTSSVTSPRRAGIVEGVDDTEHEREHVDDREC